MKQGNGVGRRTFLKNVALTGGLAARDENATEQKRGTGEERASKSTISYPRVYSGRRLSTVAFPLGGVGTGCISLGGRGQLRDWEIYNRSDKGKMPQYAFASLWVGVGERKPIARILEARFATPYDGSRVLGHMNIPGLPRLESCTFTGEYPVAKIAFQDSVVPVKLSKEAFSPFIHWRRMTPVCRWRFFAIRSPILLRNESKPRCAFLWKIPWAPPAIPINTEKDRRWKG